jgi:hypothetical protein
LGSVAVLALTLLFPGLLRSVSLDYADRLGSMVSAAVNRRSWNNVWRHSSAIPWSERMFILDQEERAFFGFLLKMLRRNRQLKLQLYPNFGIVAALFALGVLEHKKLADPLAGGQMGFATVFPLMAFLFAAMGFTASLPYSDEYQGGWIFHAAPIVRPERFLKAVKKAVFFVLFIPLFLLNVVLFGFLWPVTHAIAISLYGLAIGLATFQAMLFWFQVFPFTRKPEKGTQSQRMAIMFVMMIAYGIFMMLPNLFSSHPSLLPIVVILLLAAALVLGLLNNRAYARAIRQLDFGSD